MSSLVKFEMPNGVRVLVEPVSHVQSAAIGLWCQTGSRHERDDEGGITHLIEHMLFKGTERRTAKEIAEAIEGRGGHLNAFTDKENTCYYSRVLADDVENAIDVLSDMVLNSLLEPEELEREKGVVLEEIKRGEDEPSEHVHDLHMQARWGRHPLGKPVIGTRESVGAFERDDLAKYLDRRYRGGNLLLSVAGNVDPDSVRRWTSERLEAVQPGNGDPQCARPKGSHGYRYAAKDVEEVHFCIGTDGVSVHDDDLYSMAVLDAALGGSMSSRLFQEIREKRGLAYAIGSYSLTYGAGGAFTVYGGTGRQTWDQVQELARIEFDKAMADGLDEDELERTKRNICGNIVLALEGMSARMMRNAKSEMHYGREVPVEETVAKIEAVTNDAVVSLARRILPVDEISVTAIGPA